MTHGIHCYRLRNNFVTSYSSRYPETKPSATASTAHSTPLSVDSLKEANITPPGSGSDSSRSVQAAVHAERIRSSVPYPSNPNQSDSSIDMLNASLGLSDEDNEN